MSEWVQAHRPGAGQTRGWVVGWGSASSPDVRTRWAGGHLKQGMCTCRANPTAADLPAIVHTPWPTAGASPCWPPSPRRSCPACWRPSLCCEPLIARERAKRCSTRASCSAWHAAHSVPAQPHVPAWTPHKFRVTVRWPCAAATLPPQPPLPPSRSPAISPTIASVAVRWQQRHEPATFPDAL